MAEKQVKTIQDLLSFSIILIDKPSGPTSFQVSQYVKNSLGLKKTGHMGTLDPAVSGLLPVTLNRACRLSNYLLKSDKEYVGIMRLHSEISSETLKKEMREFIGKIKQKPPVRSRVKREEREREIKSFEILEIKGKDVLFLSKVQAGTYIRKLIHDLGEKIGGAHMLELRRTKASIFSESNKEVITLYEFDKLVEEYNQGKEENLRKVLIPADEAIKEVLPTVKIKKENLSQVLIGKPLMKEDIKEKSVPETFSAFVEERFVGIYSKVSEGDILARPVFVFN